MKFGKVTIGCTFPLAFAAIMFFCGEQLTVAFAASALIHEIGHVAAIYLCGGKIEECILAYTGAKIVFSLEQSTRLKRIAICVAGPFAGALFASAISLSGNELYAGASMALTFFNLLPVSVTDGGRILYEIVNCFSNKAAELIMFLMSCFVSAFVAVTGTYVLHAGTGSFSLLVIGIWLFIVSVLQCCKKSFRGV